jgi:membrane-bound lytic murein transglycosylase D
VAIEQVLTQEGVPTQVAALPFVESMFNAEARSYAGAVGLWQLMPGTARDLGMKISKQLDERRDILKATRIAARVLQQNYRLLGSWPLAITGYNYGPYGVQHAVTKVGSTDLMALIAAYDNEAWGFAAKNFYAEFLAVLRVLDDVKDSENASRLLN